MAILKGALEAKKFQEGKPLSAKEAIKAQCYLCNGEDEGSGEDCQGKSCPLYPFFKKWLFKGRRKALGS